ncbi:MAG TPA: hypothetical protein VNN80_28555 [Polyangiaceae bacterium]|nr:hypothetical protein [Polyangiaceae bacterium]
MTPRHTLTVCSLSLGWAAALLSCAGDDATRLTPPRPATAPTSSAEPTGADLPDAALTRPPGDAAPPAGELCDAGSAGCELPDADTATNGACELGPLGQACGLQGCPTRESAVEWSRAQPTTYVLQRPCQSEDGRPLISVATSTGTFQQALVYDAISGDLLAVQVISDYPEYCDLRTEAGYYGAFFPACDNDASLVPPLPEECLALLPWNASDAGLVPGACVFVLDGTDAGQ